MELNLTKAPICLACVECAQQEFFQNINKPVCLPKEGLNVRSKWDYLWRFVLQNYSNYCKVGYSTTGSNIKRAVLAPKIDDNQRICPIGTMHEEKSKICCNLSIIGTYVRNISRLKLDNWSPIVKVRDIKKPVKRLHLKAVTEKNRQQKFRISHTTLKKAPNILKQIAYVRLEDVLAPPVINPEILKESFMNYFKLTSTKDIPAKSAVRKPRACKNKYNSVPISSNLGMLLENNLIRNREGSALVRIERTERFLNIAACSPVPSDFIVTYNCKRDESERTYKFPKRQHHHQRLSLKTYAYLKICKPVRVMVQRMNIEDLPGSSSKIS